MNILDALSQQIRADVDAFIEMRRRVLANRDLSYANEPSEDHGTRFRNPSPRRANTAIGLLTPVGNPDRPHGLPVPGRISSAFGMRLHPIRGIMLPHNGEDIAARAGTPVAATADGVVTYAGPRGTYGNLVEIDHGNGLVTRYAHLESVTVAVGARVDSGTTIGAVGMTGAAKGVHLHYEILRNGRFQNPAPYMRAS